MKRPMAKKPRKKNSTNNVVGSKNRGKRMTLQQADRDMRRVASKGPDKKKPATKTTKATKGKHPLAGKPKSAAHRAAISAALKAHHAGKKKTSKKSSPSTRYSDERKTRAKATEALKESVLKHKKVIASATKKLKTADKATAKKLLANIKDLQQQVMKLTVSIKKRMARK